MVNKTSAELKQIWMNEVESIWNIQEPAKRMSQPLYSIVKNFSAYVAQSPTSTDLDSQAVQAALEKIGHLSDARLNYYKSARMGFIIQFFSCVVNWWNVGIFASSGTIGIDLCQKHYRVDFNEDIDFGDDVEGIPEPMLLNSKNSVNGSDPANKSLVAKEQMDKTLNEIWEHATPAEISAIIRVWKAILIRANIISWTATENPKEYRLVLEKELVGKHPDYPVDFVLIKEMTLAFSEPKDDQTNTFEKVITFVGKALCVRAWIMDLSVPAINISTTNSQTNVKISAMGIDLNKPIELAEEFWRRVTWE